MSSLALIVPLYNPHNDWFDAICDSIAGFDLVLNNVNYSVVLVNDGSTNFEESYIEELMARTKVTYVSYPENHGKGYAIRYGMSKIEADYYIYTDIDFPFGYEVIFDIYQILIDSSVDVIIGIRDKDYFNLLPLKRKMLSITLKNVNYVLTGFKLSDTQAGIKGLNNKAKKVLLDTKTNGFLFDLEFIYACLREKLNYSLIRIHPRQDITFSEFNARVIKSEMKNLIKILFRF
jgi:glycosyltransferase involved in cell wall biosynthesis